MHRVQLVLLAAAALVVLVVVACPSAAAAKHPRRLLQNQTRTKPPNYANLLLAAQRSAVSQFLAAAGDSSTLAQLSVLCWWQCMLGWQSRMAVPQFNLQLTAHVPCIQAVDSCSQTHS